MPIDFSKWDLLLRDQVITRLDSLMFGVLAAYGSYYYKPFLDKNKLVLFLMGILILSIQLTGDLLGLFNFGLYQCVFSFVVIAIGGMFLIPLLSELKTGDGLVYRTVTYISRISYSMYLLHNTFIRGFLLKHINYNSLSRILLLKPVLIKYFLYWIFTIIGAHILFIGIEKPFMDLRKKIRI